MFVLLLALSATLAQNDASWAGKTIMLKKTGLSIYRINDMGGETAVAELTELDYRVLAEKGERIQVKARNGVVGWMHKGEAVLLADAPAYFTERIQQASNESDLYNRRAWAWKLKGEFDIAIKDFTEALRIAPDAALYNNRASAYLGKRDYDKAIQDYTEAIRLNAGFALPYYNRAVLWETKKEFDKAIQDYTDAIRIDPKYVSAYRNRGYMRHIKKEYDQAIDDFTEAIRLDPKDLNAYNDRGNAWQEKKDYDRAISDFSEAMRLDPTYYFASYNRGRAWEGKKNFEKAISDYSETIRQNPRYVFGYWGRASAHSSLRQFDQAISDYKQALALDPRNARLQNALAWLLATSPDDRQRDGRRAVELARQAYDSDRQNPTFLDTLAAAYAETGEFTEAVRMQEQALEDVSYRGNDAARGRLDLYRKKQPYRLP